VVLNVDGPEGEAELQKYHRPPTLMIGSAGGLHLYFRQLVQEIKTGIRVVSDVEAPASVGPDVGCTSSTGLLPESTPP
jgi:hypothetical protein